MTEQVIEQVESTADLDMLLTEANRSLGLQYGTFDVLKANVRTGFGAASLVFALFAARPALSAVPEQFQAAYGILLAVGGLMYLALIVLSLRALAPIMIHAPIKMDWNEYKERVFGLNGRELAKLHLSAVLNAHEQNRPALARLEALMAWQYRLLAGIIGLLVVMVVASRFIG